MNDIEKYFLENEGNLIDKWMHYFEIYERHFAKYRGKEVHIVEIGVFHGGSLQMWKEYFGPKSKIYGVDVNPACKQFEQENVQIFIGDQEDRNFLQGVANSIPKIDILLDDGGHTMNQQINTFEVLFPHIDEYGVYMCEDMHTSYWPSFGGGYKKNDTFIEYSKNFIDYINAWHSESKKLEVNEFTKSAYSLHYYDSVLVIEKKPMKKPHDRRTGNPSIEPFHPKKNLQKGLLSFLSRFN